MTKSSTLAQQNRLMRFRDLARFIADRWQRPSPVVRFLRAGDIIGEDCSVEEALMHLEPFGACGNDDICLSHAANFETFYHEMAHYLFPDYPEEDMDELGDELKKIYHEDWLRSRRVPA